MPMPRHVRSTLVRAGCAALLMAAAAPALAQHALEDPIPPGARGEVRTYSGEVREIVGLSSAVAGRVDAMAAALKDLGARTTETEIRIEMSADVLFDFDKADLKPEATPSLEKVATVLTGYPAASVTVEGHTDGKGSASYNQALSERRAAAVVAWLEAHTPARRARLAVRGLGATRPVAPNTKPDGSDDPAGRQRNRRVEIVVQK
jgi:outer membrane protein OmpA-like peptidoglycan-associated protein